MARSTKNARRITVNGVAFLWRASGQDGWIALSIWPRELAGPLIFATFDYHETWLPHGAGVLTSVGDQIVITNLLVRRVIFLAVEKLGYDAARKGKQVSLPRVDLQIDLKDAVRAR